VIPFERLGCALYARGGALTQLCITSWFPMFPNETSNFYETNGQPSYFSLSMIASFEFAGYLIFPYRNHLDSDTD